MAICSQPELRILSQCRSMMLVDLLICFMSIVRFLLIPTNSRRVVFKPILPWQWARAYTRLGAMATGRSARWSYVRRRTRLNPHPCPFSRSVRIINEYWLSLVTVSVVLLVPPPKRIRTSQAEIEYAHRRAPLAWGAGGRSCRASGSGKHPLSLPGGGTVRHAGTASCSGSRDATDQLPAREDPEWDDRDCEEDDWDCEEIDGQSAGRGSVREDYWATRERPICCQTDS